ncbi:MAG: MFS transporter [Chloroflexi bacterium]|jgi:MFS transporter, DHA1 family, staphyloferrin A biosynthesis exporter|nr:MFS transporter [Chloroflexota bacterium]MBT7080384.1 MFS transporter [Chloroflexota bacterium]MBT7289446.1 MFS transporter [Chloroflexota bacterium]
MNPVRSLKYHAFRLYYGALLAQRAAFNMHMITRAYLVYELTGSPAILGIMSIAHAIPMIVTSLFGGALADRLQKKHVMLIGQTNSALVSLCIAIALTTGYLSQTNDGSWWILIAGAALDGIVTGFMLPSRHSIIPEIVGQESVTNAIALNNLAMSGLQSIGPLTAGFIVNAFDYNVVYFIMVGLSLIAVLFISFIPITGKAVKMGGNMLSNIREGLGYIGRNKNVLFVLLFILLGIFLSRPVHTLMPIFTEDILGVGITGMSWLLTCSGIGAIIASFIIATMPNKKRGLVLLLAFLFLGVATGIFAASSIYWLSLAIMVFIGAGQAIRMTLGNVLVQNYTEDKYRGRVMSVYTMEFGLTSFGQFAAGMLAAVLSVQWVLGGFAAALVLLTIIALLFIPRLRNLN